ncbi:MAG: hypothetical protein ACPGVB_09145 [Chitinophagales bacterium]
MDTQKTNKTLAKMTGLIPFLYLLSIGFFFLWVKIAEGHFPSYGNPDPKSYPILHSIGIILMLLVPISFLVWTGTVVKSLIDYSWKAMYGHFLLGFLGFSLIVGLVVFDPMGIVNWLAD